MVKGLYRLLRAGLGFQGFPHAIQFNVTFRCNQRCVYCGIYDDLREEMTTDQVRGMIDQFAALGTRRISLTGGEPLLREDLKSIIHHARSSGMFVSVATNASLVEQRIGDLEGVNSVNVTLDGPPDIHDAQRGKGNFGKVLRAIELLKRNSIPVYVNTVITRNNCGRLDEVLDLARSLDVKALVQPVFFAEQSHANNAEGYSRARYEDTALTEAFEKLIRLKDRGDPVVMLSKRYYREIIRAVSCGTKIRCRQAGRMFCTVSPDGKVAPCNLLVRAPQWLNGNDCGFGNAFRAMPPIDCGGCLSSFLDFDYLYSLKPDVVWNYYRHYLRLFGGKS